MADPGQLLDLLRSFPFLADQPPDQLERLAAQGQLLRFSLGQPISRLDQAPAQMFFLLQGTARSVVMASRLPRGVATLQRLDPGAVMGWTPLSTGRNWETLLASTDLVVLALPHVAFAIGFAFDAVLEDIAHALGPINPVRDIVCRTSLLTAEAVKTNSAGVFVDHGMVVENIAKIGFRTLLTSAQTDGLDRCLVIHGPCHFIERVNVLLDIMVA